MRKGKKVLSALVAVSLLGSMPMSSVVYAESNSSEMVTITFWDTNAGDERTEYYQQLISNFEAENPDIHIEYLGVSFSDALSKYQTAIAGGETPDVGDVNSSWASTIFNMGHCVSLDDMFSSWDEAEYIDEGAIEATRSYAKDGNMYMIPNSTNFMCLWINDQMFADAGIERDPQTWNEFFDDIEKLTDEEKGQYGYTIRGGSGSPTPLFDLIYAYLGTNEVFDENGQCTVNCDEAVEFVEKFLGMYGKYTPESDITAAYKETSANFDSGVSAMFNHNLGSYGSHVAAFGEEGFHAASFPTADNGNYVNFGGSFNGPVMFDSCENPEAAWKWITYLCSHKGQSYWNESIGQLPTNTLCYEDSWMQEQSHIQVAIEQLSKENTITYTSPQYLPDWGSINSTYIEPAIQSVMAGDMSAREMLNMWAGYLNESYANYMVG